MKRRPKLTQEEIWREADALSDAIKPLLSDKDPLAVGFALASLTALLIAGHDAASRSKVFELHVTTILELYPRAVAHFWDGDKPRKKEKP